MTAMLDTLARRVFCLLLGSALQATEQAECER